MHINIVTLFPEWFGTPLKTALLGKALESGLVSVDCLNPRDETNDPHRTVDDRPYGGGPGMVMMLEPLLRTLGKLRAGRGTGRVVMLSASGRPLTQALAAELSREPVLTLLCGRYEGIDARLGELVPLEEVSVGEAVLNGGEAAAMMLIEAATRLIPGFMGKEESGEEESFSNGLLEYPHYTRPEVFEGHAVPEILRSGDHGRIAAWRRRQSLLTTLRRRPEMLESAPLDSADLAALRELAAAEGRDRLGRNLHCALVHYPVLLGGKISGATSLTNLDIHDIARCSRTYGLGSVQIVTPIEDQQRLLRAILEHWTQGPGSRSNPDRAEALSLVRPADSLEAAVSHVAALCGQTPLVVATSAREGERPLLTCDAVRQALAQRPVLLVFGTGHGLAFEALERCDGALRPIRYLEGYNHLPVRGAAAIVLDRLLGDCDGLPAQSSTVSH